LRVQGKVWGDECEHGVEKRQSAGSVGVVIKELRGHRKMLSKKRMKERVLTT